MSQSPVTVTYSLEQILEKLDQRLDKIENKIDALQKDVSDFKTETKVSFETIRGDIKALDEKVNGLSKRLEFQEFINKGVLVGLVVAIIGGAAKLFGWVGNP